jgi:hypothetical protein
MKEISNYNVEEILKKLDKIEDRLTDLKKSTDRMDRHISFVDKVFDIIRKPFFLMMDTVSMMLPENEKREHNHIDYVFIKDGN